MATKSAERRKDTTLLRALRNGAGAGVLLGPFVVVVLLLLGDSRVDVVVWGASLLLGCVATAAGLVFAGMTRAVGRGEQRALGRDHMQDRLRRRRSDSSGLSSTSVFRCC